MKIKLITLGLVAVILSACSDGPALKAPEAQPNAAPNVCVLSAYKATGDPKEAKTGQLEIVQGEKVSIMWNVSPASSAIIKSDPQAVVGQALVLEVKESSVEDPKTKEKKKIKSTSGSKEFEVTHDTKFILLGTTKSLKAGESIDPKDASSCQSQIDIKVKAAAEKPTINSFYVKDVEIKVGASTKLCWNVTPSNAVITVMDSDKNQVYPKQVVATSAATEPKAETAAATTTVSQDHCEDITPIKSMTYTLTATSSTDTTVSSTAQTNVRLSGTEFKVVSFKANNTEGTLVLKNRGEVTLSWEVTPSDAKVSIDNGVGEGLSATGSQTVTVDKDIIYTLTATSGDKKDSKQVNVTISQGAIAQALKVELTANTNNLFSGEEVSLAWKVTANEGETVPENITYVLDGPDGKQSVAGTEVSIKPSITGEYVLEASVGGVPVRSNRVKISVRRWIANDEGGKWSSVAVVDDNTTVFGSASNKPAAIKFGRLTSNRIFKEVSFDYASAFTDLYVSSFVKDTLGRFGKYPINSIYSGSKGRLFAGTTGMLMISTDQGLSWQAVTSPRIYSDVAGGGEFPSCKGTVQSGVQDGSLEIINLKPICDIALIDNRIILGMAQGIMYMDDIDGYIESGEDRIWQGIPGKEGSASNVLSDGKVVVNKLLVYGSDIFAGTSKGVWISKDKGTTWSEINGGDVSNATAVYTLAVSVDTKKIYAGGPTGVFVGDLNSSAITWTSTGDITDGGAVNTLAVDPNDGTTLYAGTAKGVFVKRGCCPGIKWKNVTESMGGTPSVNSLSVLKSGAQIGIYAATSSGLFSSLVAVPSKPKAEPAPVTPAGTTTTTPAPATPPAPTPTTVMQTLL